MELCPTLAQIILKVNKDELACLMITGVDGLSKEKMLENRFLDGEIMKYN